MLKIAICDDLLSDRIKLKNDIEAYFESGKEQAEISAYESGDELLEVMKNEDFQIVFMDVYMEGISGVEASRQIRKLGRECAIIFTTTSPEHAMEGYAVRASDYLVKPYRREELFQAMDYVMESIGRDGDRLEVTFKDKLVQIPMEDILYLEMVENGCRVFLKKGEPVATAKTLDELLSSEREPLIRCHKKFAVNARYVARPRENEVKMDELGPVPLDPEYAESFRNGFNEWVFRNTYGGLG